MRFQDSGLVNDKLVKQAFDYAQDYTKSLATEVLQSYRDLIHADYKDDLDMLKEMFDYGDITEADYEQKKTALENERAAELKEITPDNIPAELEWMFRDNAIGAALEIQRYSDKATTELIAAAMLAECARDPVDCKKIEEKFGPAISGMIAEILHIEAYPAARAENTAASGPDTKRLYMAAITNSFRQAAALVNELQENEKAELPPERVEAAYTEAKTLWGNDKKLDKRLVDVFNKAADVLASSYRMEAGPKGTLELVNSTSTIPARIIPGKKRGGCGDDGF